MKAVVLHGIDDLRVEEVPEPQLTPGSVKIKVEYGGICGSDLHYWKHGGAGTSIVREPIILGHEIAGHITEIASDVTGVSAGQRVTVHPATFPIPCGNYSQDTLHLSPQVVHLGSAERLPHTAGAFSEYVVLPAHQVRILPANLSTRVAAASEPLAVALHALHRAGDLAGSTIMVNGAGPIGCLVVAAAGAAGVEQIWVSDLTDGALKIASELGAHHTVNIARNDTLPSAVDIVFEATGVPHALEQCFTSVRPGGTIIQVGMLPSGKINVDLAALVTREITYLGSFRFIDEITEAVNVLGSRVNIEPMLTHTFDLSEVEEAFTRASDRETASKVMLRLNQ